MKILYHLPSTLMPINTGAKQRILGTLQYLQQHGNAVTVDVVANDPYGQQLWDEAQYDFVRQYCRKVHIYQGAQQFTDRIYCKAQSFWHQKVWRSELPVDSDYHAPIGYQRFVSQLFAADRYDVVWINYLDFWALALVKAATGVQTIIDIHDIACRIRLARKHIAYLQKLRFDYAANFLREIRVLKRFDLVLVNSLVEMAELEPHLGQGQLMLVPHLLTGLPDIAQVPDYLDRSMKYDLLFVGAAYGPNVEGMNFFLTEVFPRIIGDFPSVKLAIVGNISNELKIPDAVNSHVVCLGFVPDLAAVYLASRVVICPLLSGSGTKVKLQEAMAYGLPIVTTSVGASGLALENQVNAEIEDEPENFANAVVSLLKDTDKAMVYAKALSIMYVTQYSGSFVYHLLDRALGLQSDSK